MKDLTPMRKPAILAVIAAFAIGMSFAPGKGAGDLAGCAGVAFLLYLLLGD